MGDLYPLGQQGVGTFERLIKLCIKKGTGSPKGARYPAVIWQTLEKPNHFYSELPLKLVCAEKFALIKGFCRFLRIFFLQSMGRYGILFKDT